MEFTALLALTALVQYLFFTIRVGAARGKYHVEASATRGPGMGLTFLANAALIIGALIGIALKLI